MAIVFCTFSCWLLIVLTLSTTIDCLSISPSTLVCTNKTIPDLKKEKFVQNYVNVLNSVNIMMVEKGFGLNFEGRNTSSPVFAFGQCLKHLGRKECTVCADSLSLLIFRCNAIIDGTLAGMAYSVGCFFYYDDHYFQPQRYLTENNQSVCGVENESKSSFPNAVEVLMSRLTNLAPTNSGFAIGEERQNNVSVFGLAQCWFYLTDIECSVCLTYAIPKLASCFPKQIARVLNTGCFMQYSTERFFFSKGTSLILINGYLLSLYLLGFLLSL